MLRFLCLDCLLDYTIGAVGYSILRCLNKLFRFSLTVVTSLGSVLTHWEITTVELPIRNTNGEGLNPQQSATLPRAWPPSNLLSVFEHY